MSTSIAALTYMKACRPELTTAIDAKPHVECQLAPFSSAVTPTGRGSFGETWSNWPAFAASADVSPGGSISYGAPSNILSTGTTVSARAQLRDCANHRAPGNSLRTAVHYGGTISCTTARVSNKNPGTAAYVGWVRGHNSVPYFVNGANEGNEAGVCFAAFPGQTNWTCVVSTQYPLVGLSQTTFLTSQSFTTNSALKITLCFPSRVARFYINDALVFEATTDFSVEENKRVDATWTIREYDVDMNDVPVAAPTLTATLRVANPQIKMWRPGYMGTRLVHNNW